MIYTDLCQLIDFSHLDVSCEQNCTVLGLWCLASFISILFFFFKLIVTHYSFIYAFFFFWLHWVFIGACGLSLVAVSGVDPSLRCTDFSLWWLLLLRSTGSRHTGSVLATHKLSSCGVWALARAGFIGCVTRALLLQSM